MDQHVHYQELCDLCDEEELDIALFYLQSTKKMVLAVRKFEEIRPIADCQCDADTIDHAARVILHTLHAAGR